MLVRQSPIPEANFFFQAQDSIRGKLVTRVQTFFFSKAEDGIRDKLVTGVQTCALPISNSAGRRNPSSRPSRKIFSKNAARSRANTATGLASPYPPPTRSKCCAAPSATWLRLNGSRRDRKSVV